MRRATANLARALGLAALGLGACDAPTPQKLPATAAEARADFCSLVFDAGYVTRTTGVYDLKPRASAGTVEPGVGECLFSSPAADVDLVVDCRPVHPSLAASREAAVGQPGLREIRGIGLGALYTHDPVSQVHRIVFESADPACTVYVSTGRLADDPTESLARHVADELARQRVFAR